MKQRSKPGYCGFRVGFVDRVTGVIYWMLVVQSNFTQYLSSWRGKKQGQRGQPIKRLSKWTWGIFIKRLLLLLVTNAENKIKRNINEVEYIITYLKKIILEKKNQFIEQSIDVELIGEWLSIHKRYCQKIVIVIVDTPQLHIGHFLGITSPRSEIVQKLEGSRDNFHNYPLVS